jgi:hypothetical protein
MNHILPVRLIALATALAGALALPAFASRNDEKPQMRIVCLTSLEENQAVALASRDENGKFKNLGDLELRSDLVTDWLPAQTGELHLVIRENGELKSLGHFTYPQNASRVVVVLYGETEKKCYRSVVLNPQEAKFDKGAVLICNLSQKAASVALGDKEVKVEIGQNVVARPLLDEQGMYRLTVSILQGEEEPKLWYDRQVAGNPNSRDLLFMLPDGPDGVKVQSLPVFGDFD